MVASFTTNALQSALQGLNVAQQLIDVTSQNVSSASTAGYTRKTLAVNDLVAGGQVIGVSTGDIQRTVDQSLQTTVWQQTSASNNQSTISTALGTLQSMYGTADAGTNFSTYLSTLQNDFTQLSATPSNTTLQTQTVTDASTFAASLNSVGAAITSARNDAESGIAAAVTSINGDLTTIATLNTQIASAINNDDGGAADLEDQRDQAISSLSQQMGISTYTAANGVVVVQTASGQPLADTTAHQLVFKTQPIGSTSSYPANLGGVYIDSTSGYDLATHTGSIGGTLGANLQLRDEVLPQQQAQVDELAEQTANRFSAQGLTLFTAPGGTVPANTPGDYVGFASTITINPAVAANNVLVQQGTVAPVPPATALDPGDNSLIQNVLNYTFGLNANAGGTANVPFNTTGLGASGTISLASQLPATATLSTYAADVMSVQASTASQVSAKSTATGSYLTTLQTSLSNTTAVNLDTEVANLSVYQNAYACAAQVITTEQTLMTDLLDAVQGT